MCDLEFKEKWPKCDGKTSGFGATRSAVNQARREIMDLGDYLKEHENYPATDDLMH